LQGFNSSTHAQYIAGNCHLQISDTPTEIPLTRRPSWDNMSVYCDAPTRPKTSEYLL